MSGIFEVTVTRPNRTDRYWHLANDAQTIAELLANSDEAERGFAISIRPASPQSVGDLLASQKFPELTNNLDALQVLLQQLFGSLMPAFAVKLPHNQFIALYTQPREKVSYDPRRASFA
jgi:hypothetical protein